jgi:hypothetical protein
MMGASMIEIVIMPRFGTGANASPHRRCSHGCIIPVGSPSPARGFLFHPELDPRSAGAPKRAENTPAKMLNSTNTLPSKIK